MKLQKKMQSIPQSQHSHRNSGILVKVVMEKEKRELEGQEGRVWILISK